MAINSNPVSTIEYFETARDITLEDDKIETDIHIIGWSKKLRIRALTFHQMERINQRAIDANGKLDQAEWVFHTIHEGVTRPIITYAQAKELGENNGHFVRELADEIWGLGRISKTMWDSYISEQKKLAAIEESGNPNADDSIT